jgi:hypothetical protein
MLIAVFTYQSVYWLWTKAEADEIRAERDGTPNPISRENLYGHQGAFC